MTTAIIIAAVLLAIFLGYWLGLYRQARKVKAVEDERDILLVDQAHAEYLKARFEVENKVVMGDVEITVDDPEHYIAKGAPRAEVEGRKVRRG